MFQGWPGIGVRLLEVRSMISLKVKLESISVGKIWDNVSSDPRMVFEARWTEANPRVSTHGN